MRYSAEFDRFACRGSAAAIHRQEVLARYLGAHGADWSFDLDAATLAAPGRTLSAASLLGTFSAHTATWLWAWDDPRFGWPNPVCAPLRAVYEVGEQLDVAEFTTGGFGLAEFPDPALAVQRLAVAAGQVLGGRGVWGCPGEDGKETVFLHLGDESVPEARFDPVGVPRLLAEAVAAFPADPRAVVLGLGESYRLTLDLAPERIVLHGEPGSVAIDFDAAGRIVGATSEVVAHLD